MKKLVALTLALTMGLSLSACGKEDITESSSSEQNEVLNIADEKPDIPFENCDYEIRDVENMKELIGTPNEIIYKKGGEDISLKNGTPEYEEFMKKLDKNLPSQKIDDEYSAMIEEAVITLKYENPQTVKIRSFNDLVLEFSEITIDENGMLNCKGTTNVFGIVENLNEIIK